jgi:hypothetical protein
MHIIHLTHVMIAGSRQASRAMLHYTRRAVERAHERGWIILVGDNPEGVDQAVVRECRVLKARVIVAGISDFPRNGGCQHNQASYRKIWSGLYRGMDGEWLSGYAVRDRWMVDNAQVCLFVWNGDSPGTKAGYDYAVRQGKVAHLVDFDLSGLHAIERQE